MGVAHVGAPNFFPYSRTGDPSIIRLQRTPVRELAKSSKNEYASINKLSWSDEFLGKRVSNTSLMIASASNFDFNMDHYRLELLIE